MRMVAGLCLALIFSGVSDDTRADPILNPEPAALSEDLDGTGYFEVMGNIFGIEIVDVGEFLGLDGSTFGFFFEGSDTSVSSNLIPIFDSDDSANNEAVVNFLTGIVVDVDLGMVQSTFSGSGNIGFYLTLNAFGGGSLFSDPLLNGDIDYFGTFPFLANPSIFALAFANPDDGALISLSVFNGVMPSVSVSEPTTVLLLGIGLLGLLVSRRRGLAID